MAAQSEFDKRKKERRAAALLVLAGEKKGDVVHCLTDEEMAAMADGSCSAQERERGWAHLSGCSRCYEQWYALKMEKRGIRTQRGKVHLLRPRLLALAGSALAVAVSVAVFLNIPQAPSPGRLSEEPAPSLQGAHKAEISASQNLEMEMTGDEAVSSAPAQSVTGDKGGREQREDRLALKGKRAQTAAGLQGGEKMSGSAHVMKVKIEGGSAEEVESIEQWLERVKKGCQERQGEVEFWSEIVQKGDKLLNSSDYGDDEATRDFRTFQAILQLVPRGNEKELPAERCKQILVELAEAEKSM